MGGHHSEEEKQAKIKAILESLENGASQTAACKGVQIEFSTFWRWCNKDSELKKVVASIRQAAILVVEDALYENATIGGRDGKGNVTAQIFFLCNRAPERWRNVQSVEIKHGVHDASMENLLDRYPEERRKAIMDVLMPWGADPSKGKKEEAEEAKDESEEEGEGGEKEPDA